jgi:hypothetical protein
LPAIARATHPSIRQQRPSNAIGSWRYLHVNSCLN